MANVVILTDDSGESQAYENVETVELDNGDGTTTFFVNEHLIDKLPPVTEADNGKVFGVVNGKWQAMDAPSGGTEYAHPETHPASMITDLAASATGGNYESLYNTPCGPEVVIPFGVYRPTPEKGLVGVYSAFVQLDYTPAVGDVCKVTLGQNRVAELTVQSCAVRTDGSQIWLGNLSIFSDTAEDTGEDFCIQILADYGIGVYAVRESLLYGTPYYLSMGVVLENKVRKLDSKYLPDGIATEQFVRDAVAAGGGGTAVTDKEILAEQSFTTMLMEEAGVYAMDILGEIDLAVGQEYIIQFDGVDHPCVAYDANAITPGAVMVGNGAIMGLPGNGESFIVLDYASSREITVACLHDTQPTEHTIRIYQTSDIKVSWENVTDKPFGDEIVEDMVFPTSIVPMTWSDPDGSFVFSTSISEEEAARVLADNWETAKVIWDGVSYTVKKFSLGSAIVHIGSRRADDGIPFSITCVAAGAISESPTILISDYATPAPAEGGGVEIAHSLSATLNTIVTHKIPDRFQHQADWDEQDESKAGYIKNRPFGLELAAGAVVAEMAECEYDPDLGFLFTNLESMTSDLNKSKVRVGAKYTIQVGDYTYRGVGITGDEVPVYVPFIGGVVIECGILVMDGDTVAGTVAAGVMDQLDLLFFIDEYADRYLPDGENGTVYSGPVSIELAEDIIKKLEPKFLEPFEDDSNRTILVSEQTVEFTKISNIDYITVYEGTVPDTVQPVEGEKYTVFWDGVEYVCKCQRFQDANEGVDYLYLGNNSISGWVDTDSGEPFVLVQENDAANVVTYSEASTHTVAIWKGAEQHRLKTEYAPLPPEFDLTAMGLPDVPMDGTTVSCKCDTGELMAALNRGAVEYRMTVSGMPMTGIGSAMCMNGEYQVGAVSMLQGTVLLSFFSVRDGMMNMIVKPLTTT